MTNDGPTRLEWRIRRATAADKPEWLRLRAVLWPGETRAALEGDLDHWLDATGTAVFVAESTAGGLAGFVEVSLRAYAEGCASSPVGFIEGWFVTPEARGRGVGHRLVEAAEAWASSAGCREMASDSLLENRDGHAAHRALGYAEVERLVCFRKDLPAASQARAPTGAIPLRRRPVVGIMGAGESAATDDVARAERLGELVAREGWVVLTGGRDAGVMAAAHRGAKRVAGSLTVGILPSEGGEAAPGADVAIFTGLGNARNAINVLSSDVVVACGRGGSGTASEVALAIKSRKPIILLAPAPEAAAFFRTLDACVAVVATPEAVVAAIRETIDGDRP